MQQNTQRMSVYLSKKLAAEVRQRVEAGEFCTKNELLRAALRDLFEREPRGDRDG